MKWLFFFILIFTCLQSFAQEVYYLNRSPRALLSGDAYTAAVDDEYSQYYNPASLGRVKGFAMTPFQADFAATNVLAEKERLENFPKKDPVKIADRVMGVPLYVHGGTTPSVKMAGFGFTAFINQSANLVLHDKTTPVLDINYRYDRGYMVGYAFSMGKGKPKKKKTKKKDKSVQTFNGQETSIGYSFKSVYRDSLVGSFPLFGTELVNIITSANDLDYHSLRNQLGYTKGHGYGHDVGLLHSIYRGNTELSYAFSVLDVADTKFKVYEGTGKIPSQKMMLSTGVSFKQDWALFDYRLSFDVHPINLPIDFNRKIHAGIEAGPKIVKLLAGYNGGYLSYGAIVDLYILRVMGGFYGIETGSKYKEEQSKRAVVYFSLLDFSFDVP